MKAVVIHKYGGPEELKFEEYRDPAPKAGEVLVRTAATSVNPIDIMRRSGAADDFMPIKFPGIVGGDVAGTVAEVGPGVKQFSAGDKVFGMADETYAEFCVVPASNLLKIPAGLDIVDAAALPVVTTTGSQLITLGTNVQKGHKVLVTGAAGSVGRSAVFTAKERGAFVIAGVRKSQAKEAAILGANEVVTIDDDKAIAKLPPLDAVADCVNGETAQKLIAKVKPGGVFASVLGPPQNAKDYPSVKVVPVYATPDTKVLLQMTEAVIAGKLKIPISKKFTFKDAANAHKAIEARTPGKVLLTAK